VDAVALLPVIPSVPPPQQWTPLLPAAPSMPPPHTTRRYSNDYTHNLPTGQKQLIVAEVLVGRWTKGQQGMKVYPLLPGEKYKKYNSLVNNEANPSSVVWYDPNTAGVTAFCL
jgi:hypothetical protein